MPRKARKVSAQKIYHVVVKGADRQVMFEETRDYKKYIDILEYYREECHFELYAYCLMSNHVHLLIHINEIPLSTIFRKINTAYAGWFNAKYDRTGFLQDGRYFSEPVDTHNYLLAAIRYIHYNPVKAGLEKFPGQKYNWSSYNAFIKSDSQIIDSEFVLTFFGGTVNFVDFHKQKNTEEFWDIEKARKRIPDDVAQTIIFELTGCSGVTEFQALSLKKRNEFIQKIHGRGVSIRQINRLTGVPKGIIDRIL